MEPKRVLIIDDEINFCKLVKKNLELEGEFAVAIAVNGEDGINLARKAKPNVILLDILMPGMDGFKVLEELKKDKTTMKIPVIMLTAKEDDNSKFKAATLYDDLYLTKPVEASALKAKINWVLNVRGSK